MDIMKMIEGNLLDITDGIICHQVNCLGIMGGLAGQIKQKWHVQVKNYIDAGRNGKIELGDYLLSYLTPDLVLCHIAGQYNIGPNTDLNSVSKAFTRFKEEFLDTLTSYFDIPVYIPFMMGCGMGGGNWKDYLNVVETVLPDVIVVARPEDLKKFKV